MGERLLKRWIDKPLLCPAAIADRFDAIDELRAAGGLVTSLHINLKQVRDIEKICSRVVLGRANPKNIAALRTSLEVFPEIADCLTSLDHSVFTGLKRQIKATWLKDLVHQLQISLAVEPPTSLAAGGVIRAGFSSELDQLRGLATEGRQWIAMLEQEERDRTGINNLKVRYNKVFGYYIEVTKSYLPVVPDDYVRKQTLVNAERFITPKLKEYEEKVLSAADKIIVLEEKLFDDLVSKLVAVQKELADLAGLVARLDVLNALAIAAIENDYVRPDIKLDDCLTIKDGRHPVVEYLAAESGQARFVANDILLDASTRQLLIVTGPNMAGKSTLLRQVALTCIMAQMGCFVPAKSAVVGVVDRVFTRVGASDEIAAGRSTFMVEMEETAHILRNATAKSLLILDEIGRGTSTYDGMSLAWSVVEHIHEKIGCRTLFATHYHELISLAAQFSRIHNVHVSVKLQGEKVIFLHRLIDGGINRSYGINVARLAGLPLEVIERAESLLNNLEYAQRNVTLSQEKPVENKQLKFFENSFQNEVIDRLKDTNVDNLTPVAALNLLVELKESLE